MMKIEKIKSCLKCALCNKLLDDPIILPCGELICSIHTNDVIYENEDELVIKDSISDVSQSKFKCLLCESEHVQPQGGFQHVKAIQNILRLKTNNINCTKFTECKNIIGELQEQVCLGENVIKDAEFFIHEYFGAIKKQVNLQRETLKNSIDIYYETIIEKVESSENDCYKISKDIENESDKLNVSKKELEEIIRELDSYEINDIVYEAIIKKATNLKSEFLSMVEQLKNDILGKRSYEFKPITMRVEDIFGIFEIVRVSCFLIIFINI